ncbi:MAG: hypothetical protein CL933_04115 [Deltaproteobacteria bacterium]|nr:hypothetical protein [Deltaproteobacteria bacterium]
MTRIVESAIVRESSSSPLSQWTETNKLTRGVQDDFFVRRGLTGINLKTDLSHAPSEVWTEEALLGISVASLLDWAIDQPNPANTCGPPRTISLAVEARGDEATEDRIAISVGPEGVCLDGAVEEEPTVSALAIAADAADAVEVLGEQLSEKNERDDCMRIIELPQPSKSSEFS